MEMSLKAETDAKEVEEIRNQERWKNEIDGQKEIHPSVVDLRSQSLTLSS